MTACVRTCNVKYMRKRRLHLSATDPGRGTVPYKLSVAADAGDPLALALWSDIGLKLGVGLSNVVWLLNPHRIVIGGGVAKAGERLIGKIRSTIRERTEKTFWESLEIVPATFGNDARNYRCGNACA